MLKNINIPSFSDGTPIKTQNVAFEAYILQSDVTGNIGLTLRYNNKTMLHCIANGMSNTADRYSIAYVLNINGLYLQYGTDHANVSTWSTNSLKARAAIPTLTDIPYFDALIFNQLNGGTIKAGSKIKVWAIRMEE